MKVFQFSEKVLSIPDFSELSNHLIDAIYSIEPEIADIYDVHINRVSGAWVVEFTSKSSKLPILKVDTYTTYDSKNREILKFRPLDLHKLPDTLTFRSYNDALFYSTKLCTILDFLVELYDFEFPL